MNWFLPSTLDTTTSNCVEERPPDSIDLNNTDERLYAGDYEAPSEAMLWDAEREALLKLERHPELMAPGSAAEAFYNNRNGSSAWQFARARKLYEDAFDFPVIERDLLALLYARHDVLSDSCYLLDSLQKMDPATVDASIRQELLSVRARKVVVNESIAAILATFRTFSIAQLQDLQTWCADLPEAVLYESNLKTVLTLRIKKALGEPLSEADYAALRAIAYQCPLNGGSAVTTAPYDLPPGESLTFFNENIARQACQAEARETGKVRAVSTSMLLQPNPARDRLTVRLSESSDERSYTVCNALGRVCHSGSINSETSVFDINTVGLVDGVYYLHIVSGSSLSITRSFILQK